MKTNDEPDKSIKQSEDEVFFAPLDKIKSIEEIIVNLEIARDEFQKIAKGMKPINN